MLGKNKQEFSEVKLNSKFHVDPAKSLKKIKIIIINGVGNVSLARHTDKSCLVIHTETNFICPSFAH
jgi:hypothetical protein